MKLLVPVDFSLASLNALKYAKMLAGYFDADIQVLHVCSQAQKEEKQKKLTRFSIEYPDIVKEVELTHIKGIECKVTNGEVAREIVDMVENENIDLTLMGTKAHHSLIDRWLGSISSRVMRNSSKPVLIIPEEEVFSKIDTIAFAKDFSDEDIQTVAFLEQITKVLQAKLIDVHVHTGIEGKKSVRELTPNDPFSRINYERYEVSDNSIVNGLTSFIDQYKVDWLVFYLPELDFPEKLLHGKLSKAMAFGTKIPLLILHAEKN